MSEVKINPTEETQAPQILDEGGQNANHQAIGIDYSLLKEENAQITDNQTFEQSEPAVDEVQGEHTQDSQTNAEFVPDNWEASSKYFQSEKDKTFEENKALKEDLNKYKALGEFVDGRPDVQEYLNGMLTGQQPDSKEQPQQGKPNISSPPEDFDPWDAYNDPQSSSYIFRQKQEQNNVSAALDTFKNELSGTWEKEKKLERFDKELGNLGLDDVQKKQFYEFANTPVAQMGTEQLVSMWRATSDSTQSSQPDSSTKDASMNAVRRTQSTPQQGTGVLQGSAPEVKKTGSDAMWEGIMNASKKNKIV